MGFYHQLFCPIQKKKVHAHTVTHYAHRYTCACVQSATAEFTAVILVGRWRMQWTLSVSRA